VAAALVARGTLHHRVHVWHDRPPQGRHAESPRRVPQLRPHRHDARPYGARSISWPAGLCCSWSASTPVPRW
jgi:hypothetical protein